MSKQEKLIAKLIRAKKLKWMEIVTLLNGLGFESIEGSGSRVKFIKNEIVIDLHRSHPVS